MSKDAEDKKKRSVTARVGEWLLAIAAVGGIGFLGNEM